VGDCQSNHRSDQGVASTLSTTLRSLQLDAGWDDSLWRNFLDAKPPRDLLQLGRWDSGRSVPVAGPGTPDISGVAMTVTHPDANRYFITLRRTIDLVLAAGSSNARGGLYVPDMWHQTRVAELALYLIGSSGLSCPEDISDREHNKTAGPSTTTVQMSCRSFALRKTRPRLLSKQKVKSGLMQERCGSANSAARLPWSMLRS